MLIFLRRLARRVAFTLRQARNAPAFGSGSPGRPRLQRHSKGNGFADRRGSSPELRSARFSLTALDARRAAGIGRVSDTRASLTANRQG